MSTPELYVNGAERKNADFHRRALIMLQKSEVPFLVGGAYSLAVYIGIWRDTKDLDIFVRERDCEKALQVLAEAGYRTEMVFQHWLGKAYSGDEYVDIIFNSGNGMCEVDDDWFAHAVQETVLDVAVLLCPVEETLWQKSFIMERERFDGADVAHLLHAHGDSLDWPRLVNRFGDHWRLLLAHLVLYTYIYPGDHRQTPGRVMRELLRRLQNEGGRTDAAERVCRGALLSRAQYLVDVEARGYEDARLAPKGGMSLAEVAAWTAPVREDVASPQ